MNFLFWVRKKQVYFNLVSTILQKDKLLKEIGNLHLTSDASRNASRIMRNDNMVTEDNTNEVIKQSTSIPKSLKSLTKLKNKLKSLKQKNGKKSKGSKTKVAATVDKTETPALVQAPEPTPLPAPTSQLLPAPTPAPLSTLKSPSTLLQEQNPTTPRVQEDLNNVTADPKV